MNDLNLEGLSDKQLRLFAVQCARRVQHLMTDPRSIAALDVAERHANGQATDEELKVARNAAYVAWDATWDVEDSAVKAANFATRAATSAVALVTASDAAWTTAWDAASAAGSVAAGEIDEHSSWVTLQLWYTARDRERVKQQKILDEIRQAVMTLKDPFELAAKEEYFKLLELAAKAAGIWDETDPSNGMLKPTGQYWDPLRDDGDALRLAATLGLVVDCSNLSAALPYKRGVRWLDQTMSNMELLRRAIVFAASQIGKQQEQL